MVPHRLADFVRRHRPRRRSRCSGTPRTRRAAASSPRTRCAWASRSRAAPTSRSSTRKPATVPDIQKALASVGVTDARVNTLDKSGRRGTERALHDLDADRLRQRRAASCGSALGTVAPVDRAQSQIEAVGPSLGNEYLIKAGRGARHRDRDPVPLHRVPLRLELHLRSGRRHRARARCRDDDRHLRDRGQARGRRVPGRGADRHRLLRHGYDRHSRPYSRKREGHGGRAVRADRQYLDLADDDAFGQHARDRRRHARRVAGVRRRELAEFRLRAARRHLLRRLSLDLLLRAARQRAARTADGFGRGPTARCSARRRSSGPRTVAEARAQQAANVSREDVLAARKERRKKTVGRRHGGRPRALQEAAPAARPLPGAGGAPAETYVDETEYEDERTNPKRSVTNTNTPSIRSTRRTPACTIKNSRSVTRKST